MPSIIGIRRVPLYVADRPRTAWKNSGMKMIMPNIPMPMQKRATTVTTTIRLRKMSRGMIGSAARDSIHMKAPSMTADILRAPITCSDTHSYWFPAQDSPTIRGVTHSTSTVMPI